MNDTTLQMEKRFRELMMALSPGERVAMACRMFSTAKALVIAGLQAEGVDAQNADDLRERIFLRFYGQDFGQAEKARIVQRLKTHRTPPTAKAS